MAHPLKHAESSARKFGGKTEDYLRIHNWFDESKAFLPDFRHRGLRHHAEGIFLCERIFGVAITNSEGFDLREPVLCSGYPSKVFLHMLFPDVTHWNLLSK
jgi:hypothetical protein